MRKQHQLMPMLPGFYLPKRGRKPYSRQQKISQKIASLKKKSFKQIGEIFGQFIPARFLKQELSGSMSRRRLFTKESTLWSFLGQVLDADGGCREAVKKLQSCASNHRLQIPSSSTASYCAARKKLDENMLLDIFKHTTEWAGARTAPKSLNGHNHQTRNQDVASPLHEYAHTSHWKPEHC